MPLSHDAGTELSFDLRFPWGPVSGIDYTRQEVCVPVILAVFPEILAHPEDGPEKGWKSVS